MSDYLAGLRNVIQNFNNIDTNKDNQLSKTEITAAKTSSNLTAEGKSFLEAIVNNNRTLPTIQQAFVDGNGITSKDLESFSKETKTHIDFLFCPESKLIDAIENNPITQHDNENAVLIFNEDGTTLDPELHNLYAVALYRAGYLTKAEFDKTLVKGILNMFFDNNPNTNELQAAIKKLQLKHNIPNGDNGNKIGPATRQALYKELSQTETTKPVEVASQAKEIVKQAYKQYTIKEGDTLEKIARKELSSTPYTSDKEYNRLLTSFINKLKEINRITNPKKIQIGDVILLPNIK